MILQCVFLVAIVAIISDPPGQLVSRNHFIQTLHALRRLHKHSMSDVNILEANWDIKRVPAYKRLVRDRPLKKRLSQKTIEIHP